MSKNILIIRGDWNDADYVIEETKVSEKDLKTLLPIIKKLKLETKKAHSRVRNGKHDYWRDSYYTLKVSELDIFEEYMPSGYEQSCHSIESIRLLEVINDKNLF